ncbi:hypothetical protein JCM3766R1_002118, partial [Sporobolomyces carnicolor]
MSSLSDFPLDFDLDHARVTSIIHRPLQRLSEGGGGGGGHQHAGRVGTSLPPPRRRVRSRPVPPSVPGVASTSASSKAAGLRRQRFEEAKALYESGLAISRDNPRSAIAHFIQAAKVFDEANGQEKRRDKSYWQAATCYGTVGWAAKKQKDWHGAKLAFEQVNSYDSRHRTGDVVDQSSSRHWFCSRRSKTLKRSSLPADCRTCGTEEAITLYHLSLVSSDLVSASDYLKRAALMYADMDQDNKEAMCLAELGNLFRDRDVSVSLFHWRQARTLFRSLPEPRCGTWDGHCSYRMGKICATEKRFEHAVEFFENACASYRGTGMRTDEAWSLYRLALVMLKVQSRDLAIDYLTEAKRLFSDIGNEQEAEANCLLRLAEIFKFSNREMAKTLLGEALELVNPTKANKIVRRSTTILRFLSSGDEGYSSARARGQDALYILAEEGGGVIDEEAVADRGSSGDNWSFAAATEDGGKSFVGAELEDARRDGLEEPRVLDEDGPLILNVDGAIAVSFCDLLKSSGAFTPDEAAEY